MARSASCGTFSDAGSWTVVDWQSEILLSRERAAYFSALQGVSTVTVDGQHYLLVSHGGAANATMLDPQLKPLISGGMGTRGNDDDFPLLADVAVGTKGFMWTNYRTPEVIWTNRFVGESETIALGDEFSGAVGIAYAASINAFLVPSRRSDEIAIIRGGEGEWTVDIAELSLPEELRESTAYDIQVDGNCATMVYREAGVVAWLAVNTLDAGANNSVMIAFPDIRFERPQHAQWYLGRYYVVETDARRVRVISPVEKTIWNLNLPHRVFRGLAVGPDGRLFLSGFSDEPPVSESRTGIFELSVPEELEAPATGDADK